MNPHQPPPPPYPSSSSSDPAASYTGTHIMGTLVPPSSHHAPPNPYVQYGTPHPPPLPPPNDMDNVCKKLNSWSNKAETTAANIWTNLKAGQSVAGSTWGKSI